VGSTRVPDNKNKPDRFPVRTLTEVTKPCPSSVLSQFLDCVLCFSYGHLRDILCLHCALAAAQCIVIGPVYLCVCLWRGGGRAVSEPYYSQRACSVCVSLSAFFIFFLCFVSWLLFLKKFPLTAHE